MAEELMVVLKRSENSGFGFFLTTGPPHVIDNIIENSPASECGTLEVGDVILKVNETDVHRYTTKEVLKCLRLSNDLVTLQLKRDPKNKTYKKNKNSHYSDNESSNIFEIKSSRIPESPSIRKTSLNSPSSSAKLVVVESPCRKSRIPTVKKLPPLRNAPQSPQNKRPKPSQIPKANGGGNVVSLHCNNQGQQQPQNQSPFGITEPTSAPPFTKAPRFEAYMMTGDVILNLSRTPQTSNLIPPHAKKVETVRDCPNRIAARANGALAPRASGESTPSSSSSPSHSESSESVNLIKKKDKTNINKKDHSNNTLSNNSSDRQNRKDSIANDTLLLCEEIDRDDDDENNDETNYDNAEFSNTECAHRTGGGISDDLNDEFSACVTSSSSSLHQHQKNFNLKEDNYYTQQSSSAANIVGDYSQEYSQQPSDSLASTTTNRQNISSSSSSTVKSDEIISSPDETSFSVPVSPSLSTPLLDVKETANSVPTSPEQNSVEVVVRRQHNGVVRKCDASGFRTSKSEDHLQQTQRDGIGAVIPIDIDEDVNSSLNTLLDTRQDSEDSQTSNRDRIVWTYNAPVQPNQHHNQTTTSPNSHSSSISSSPQHTDSPASPTSVSSSVMSSSGSKGAICGVNAAAANGTAFLQCPINGDQSVSEAISNISSPDYQDDDNLLSSRDIIGMALSDPSDSDSTILVSEAMQRKKELQNEQQRNDHKLIIQVKGVENNIRVSPQYCELKDSEDEQATLTDDQPTVLTGYGHDTRESSPPVSDDGSDVDSLHSYHYSPKAVDMPSAIRLAKRLYSLDGFKKSDVSRHLSKNNDFSRAVADEYLKYFNFETKTLDQSLREFLQQFALSGETQERERVLVHFSKRYLDCNPGSFNSQDAVHTLTCAIMLLNTDLHGQNIGRKMTCSEFVDNLVELNDGENFPKDVLKNLYHAIKNHPLEWALDEELTEQQKQRNENTGNAQLGSNPFLDTSQSATAVEYKKGYVMRKSCYESNFKKTPFGKRSWKMFYCTLRDLVLYLHKDEHGFRKNQMSDNLHNAIRIHHALATKATDYTKKQHVFRLQTADQAEYLFQTSDSKELQSWIDTINYVSAGYSAPPLEGGVGSQKRFQRPLLPSSQTKLTLKEQLRAHEQQVQQLENILSEHKRGPIPNKGLPLQNYKEKENYLQYELKRYKTYVYILDAKILADEQLELQSNLLNPDDPFAPTRGITGGITNPANNVLQPGQQTIIQPIPTPQIASPTTVAVTTAIPANRYSYRTAIYRSEVQQDLG